MIVFKGRLRSLFSLTSMSLYTTFSWLKTESISADLANFMIFWAYSLGSRSRRASFIVYLSLRRPAVAVKAWGFHLAIRTCIHSSTSSSYVKIRLVVSESSAVCHIKIVFRRHDERFRRTISTSRTIAIFLIFSTKTCTFL